MKQNLKSFIITWIIAMIVVLFLVAGLLYVNHTNQPQINPGKIEVQIYTTNYSNTSDSQDHTEVEEEITEAEVEEDIEEETNTEPSYDFEEIEDEEEDEEEEKIKAVWMYNFDELDNDDIIDDLDDLDINLVLLSVEGRSIAEESSDYDNDYTDKLADFIAEAHENNIEVHAMTLQDPVFATFEKHESAVELIEYFISYNNQNDEKLDGIHLDTEPHALDEWKIGSDEEREEIMKDYIIMVDLVSDELRGTDLELSEAVTWWYNEKDDDYMPSGDSSLHERYVDFIVIMCYGGIGSSADDVIWRVEDEIDEVDTIVGISVNELGDADEVDDAIEEIDDEFSREDNYLGTAIFKYELYK